MLEFKKIINKRVWLLTVLDIIMLLIFFNQCFGNFLLFPTPKESLISDFQTGLLLGFEIALLFVSIKYKKMLNNEQQLQDLYNSEHDERKILIRQKAGFPVIWILSMTILLGAIIAGYFNVIVFCTLLFVAIAQLIICALLKLFYSKKY